MSNAEVKEKFLQRRQQLILDFQKGDMQAKSSMTIFIMSVSKIISQNYGRAFKLSIEDLESESYIWGFEFTQTFNAQRLNTISFYKFQLERHITLKTIRYIRDYYDLDTKSITLYYSVFKMIDDARKAKRKSEEDMKQILKLSKEEMQTIFKIFTIITHKFERLNVVDSEFQLSEDECFREVYLSIAKGYICDVLKTIDPIQEKVILCRYGFIDGGEKTFSEISDIISEGDETKRRTSVRYRQIHAKAMRRMRHISRSRRLEHVCELL